VTDFLPREFDLYLFWLLTIVIKKRAKIDPKTTFP
jgi:hypothetical protein